MNYDPLYQAINEEFKKARELRERAIQGRIVKIELGLKDNNPKWQVFLQFLNKRDYYNLKKWLKDQRIDDRFSHMTINQLRTLAKKCLIKIRSTDKKTTILSKLLGEINDDDN